MTSSIVISGGDPAGISTEIIEKSVEQLVEAGRDITYYCNGGESHIDRMADLIRQAGGEVFIGQTPSHEGDSGSPLFQIIDITGEVDNGYDPIPGNPDSTSGLLSFLALERSVNFIEKHGCAGFITAPLSKEWVIRSGQSSFTGHTGYLAKRANAHVIMLMHGVNFSVIPITEHVPIVDVSSALKERLQSEQFTERLRELRSVKMYSGDMRWALCSLNPHAGEGGLLGTEEVEYMNAVAEYWRKEGLPVDGPLPADGAFQQENRRRYRLYLCPYHDQALIPFKAIEGERGVNATIGLPYLRVSPDHGTAYGIAGQEKASAVSFHRCIETIVNGELVESE